jgi:hypothetical protein
MTLDTATTMRCMVDSPSSDGRPLAGKARPVRVPAATGYFARFRAAAGSWSTLGTLWQRALPTDQGLSELADAGT